MEIDPQKQNQPQETPEQMEVRRQQQARAQENMLLDHTEQFVTTFFDDPTKMFWMIDAFSWTPEARQEFLSLRGYANERWLMLLEQYNETPTVSNTTAATIPSTQPGVHPVATQARLEIKPQPTTKRQEKPQQSHVEKASKPRSNNEWLAEWTLDTADKLLALKQIFEWELAKCKNPETQAKIQRILLILEAALLFSEKSPATNINKILECRKKLEDALRGTDQNSKEYKYLYEQYTQTEKFWQWYVAVKLLVVHQEMDNSLNGWQNQKDYVLRTHARERMIQLFQTWKISSIRRQNNTPSMMESLTDEERTSLESFQVNLMMRGTGNVNHTSNSVGHRSFALLPSNGAGHIVDAHDPQALLDAVTLGRATVMRNMRRYEEAACGYIDAFWVDKYITENPKVMEEKRTLVQKEANELVWKNTRRIEQLREVWMNGRWPDKKLIRNSDPKFKEFWSFVWESVTKWAIEYRARIEMGKDLYKKNKENPSEVQRLSDNNPGSIEALKGFWDLYGLDGKLHLSDETFDKIIDEIAIDVPLLIASWGIWSILAAWARWVAWRFLARRALTGLAVFWVERLAEGYAFEAWMSWIHYAAGNENAFDGYLQRWLVTSGMLAVWAWLWKAFNAVVPLKEWAGLWTRILHQAWTVAVEFGGFAVYDWTIQEIWTRLSEWRHLTKREIFDLLQKDAKTLFAMKVWWKLAQSSGATDVAFRTGLWNEAAELRTKAMVEAMNDKIAGLADRIAVKIGSVEPWKNISPELTQELQNMLHQLWAWVSQFDIFQGWPIIASNPDTKVIFEKLTRADTIKPKHPNPDIPTEAYLETFNEALWVVSDVMASVRKWMLLSSTSTFFLSDSNRTLPDDLDISMSATDFVKVRKVVEAKLQEGVIANLRYMQIGTKNVIPPDSPQFQQLLLDGDLRIVFDVPGKNWAPPIEIEAFAELPGKGIMQPWNVPRQVVSFQHEGKEYKVSGLLDTADMYSINFIHEFFNNSLDNSKKPNSSNGNNSVDVGWKIKDSNRIFNLTNYMRNVGITDPKDIIPTIERAIQKLTQHSQWERLSPYLAYALEWVIPNTKAGEKPQTRFEYVRDELLKIVESYDDYRIELKRHNQVEWEWPMEFQQFIDYWNSQKIELAKSYKLLLSNDSISIIEKERIQQQIKEAKGILEEHKGLIRWSGEEFAYFYELYMIQSRYIDRLEVELSKKTIK